MILHCTALTFWRACNWDLEAEPPTGSRGRTPGQGSGVRGSKALKLKGHHGSGKFAWFSESAQSSNDYVNGLISAFSLVRQNVYWNVVSTLSRTNALLHILAVSDAELRIHYTTSMLLSWLLRAICMRTFWRLCPTHLTSSTASRKLFCRHSWQRSVATRNALVGSIWLRSVHGRLQTKRKRFL